MSLDNKVSEYNRSKLAVWHYPVSDRYTKVVQKQYQKAFKICFNLNLIQIWAKFSEPMSNETWGIFESMDHAIEMIRESEGKKDGYALIADATDLR